jgi:predicted patatin/cPLA2 family phospholipase
MKCFKELQEAVNELDRQVQEYREVIQELQEMNKNTRKYLISQGIHIPEVPEVA